MAVGAAVHLCSLPALLSPCTVGRWRTIFKDLRVSSSIPCMSSANHPYLRRLGSIVLAIVLVLSSFVTAGARTMVADDCCDSTEVSDCSLDHSTESTDDCSDDADCDDETSVCSGICHCCSAPGFAAQIEPLFALAVDVCDRYPAVESALLTSRSLPVDHPPC